jgi:membrane-bound ClpP family serine protease
LTIDNCDVQLKQEIIIFCFNVRKKTLSCFAENEIQTTKHTTAMWLIITLIALGALLLVAEIILLPGLTVAGIGGFIAYGVAIFLGFEHYGTGGGFIVVGVIVAVSALSIALSLRAKTWQRLALKQQIDGISQSSPELEVKTGDRGMAVTRLAPMGKVLINNETYEAKSLGDLYVDQKTEVEVVGFENFNVIVKVVH